MNYIITFNTFYSITAFIINITVFTNKHLPSQVKEELKDIKNLVIFCFMKRILYIFLLFFYVLCGFLFCDWNNLNVLSICLLSVLSCLFAILLHFFYVNISCFLQLFLFSITLIFIAMYIFINSLTDYVVSLFSSRISGVILVITLFSCIFCDFLIIICFEKLSHCFHSTWQEDNEFKDAEQAQVLDLDKKNSLFYKTIYCVYLLLFIICIFFLVLSQLYLESISQWIIKIFNYLFIVLFFVLLIMTILWFILFLFYFVIIKSINIKSINIKSKNTEYLCDFVVEMFCVFLLSHKICFLIILIIVNVCLLFVLDDYFQNLSYSIFDFLDKDVS